VLKHTLHIISIVSGSEQYFFKITVQYAQIKTPAFSVLDMILRKAIIALTLRGVALWKMACFVQDTKE
jgi:hypothetical protein